MTQKERVEFKRNVDPELFKKVLLTNSDKDTAKYFEIPLNLVKTTISYLGIKFSNEEKKQRRILNCMDVTGLTYEEYQQRINHKRRETLISKYGENYNDVFQQNREKTMQDRYGVSNPSQVKEFRDKVVDTNIRKFGAPCNLSTENTKQKIKETCLERYGCEYAFQADSVKEKTRETCLEKYGVDNIAKSDYMKLKSQETCLNKYGSPFASQSSVFKDKLKRNSLVKYGTEHPMQAPEVKERLKQSVMLKYGVSSTLQRDEVKDKIKQTCVERYGVEYSSQAEITKEHTKQTNQRKYGVDWFCTLPQCRLQGKNNSAPNRNFVKLMVDNNILFTQEFILENYVYDFKVGDILVEINPAATHNSTWSPFGDYSGLKSDYHQKKSLCAERNGFRCIHVWDWDSVFLIILMLKQHRTLYARNLSISSVDKIAADEFLNKCHLQSTCKGQDVLLGLYDNNKLVQVMTFGRPRYSSRYSAELLRLCSLPECAVIGGAQKLFKYYIDNYKPETIVSYCDRSKFSGDVYKRLNFISTGNYQPSKHWYNMKTGKHITDNLLRQRGFDQLLGKEYGCFGKGTSNEELMLQHDFVEIYDAGQETFVWRA